MITGRVGPKVAYGSQYVGGATQWYILNLSSLMKYHSKNSFMPNYPWFLIDSWDYDNLITVKLLDLYNLYLKL